MRDRVELFGGRFEVHSAPGAGTSVEVDLPLEVRPLTAEVRVLVADDHTMIRQGLISILQGPATSSRWWGRRRRATRRWRKRSELRPDVVVLDITMPRLNGLEAARRIRKALPRTRILVLTMHDDEEYVLRTVRAGASGTWSRTAPPPSWWRPSARSAPARATSGPRPPRRWPRLRAGGAGRGSLRAAHRPASARSSIS